MSIGRQRKVAYRQALAAGLRSGSAIKCFLCGKKIIHVSDLTVDHILPKSKGGSSTSDNFAPAHERCNRQKGSRVIADLIYNAKDKS